MKVALIVDGHFIRNISALLWWQPTMWGEFWILSVCLCIQRKIFHPTLFQFLDSSVTFTEEEMLSQSPTFYILWSGLCYLMFEVKGPKGSIFNRLVTYHLQGHYKLFIGLIIVGNSFFPFGVRVGWWLFERPLITDLIICCSYTLFTEICDERGRKYNYIVGRVVWVAGLVAVPWLGLWKK